jgi:DNA-binding XRE family transcriptional regulator
MTGRELRALRESWGLTQAQLAHLIGYQAKVGSDMEHDRKPVPNMLARLLYRTLC